MVSQMENILGGRESVCKKQRGRVELTCVLSCHSVVFVVKVLKPLWDWSGFHISLWLCGIRWGTSGLSLGKHTAQQLLERGHGLFPTSNILPLLCVSLPEAGPCG